MNVILGTDFSLLKSKRAITQKVKCVDHSSVYVADDGEREKEREKK